MLTAWLAGEEFDYNKPGFMGKSWDNLPPGPRYWRALLDITYPGGYLFAFSGTRTADLLGISCRLGGWEPFDRVASFGWVQGQGMKKGVDVGKALDQLDAVDMRQERQLKFTAWMRQAGLTSSQIDKITNTNMGGHYTTSASQPAIATRALFEMLRPHLKCRIPVWIEEMINQRTVESEDFKRREVVGHQENWGKRPEIGPTGHVGEWDITAPATPLAKAFDGYGTGLAPKHEPILLFRKPREGRTFAQCAREFGSGGLDISSCRVGNEGACYLTGQRPYDILDSKQGDISWEKEKSLCALCARDVENKKKPLIQATKESFVQSPAGQTLSERAETSHDDTSKMDTGCFSGQCQGEPRESKSANINLSTGESGKMQTGQSRTDMLSIIKTETDSTTDLKICSLCGADITPQYTKQEKEEAERACQNGQSTRENYGAGKRWPPNVAFSHVPHHSPCVPCDGDGCDECHGVGMVGGCVRVGSKRVRGTAPIGKPSRGTKKESPGIYDLGFKTNEEFSGYTDLDGKETVADWLCVEGCAVRALDEMAPAANQAAALVRPGAKLLVFTRAGNERLMKTIKLNHLVLMQWTRGDRPVFSPTMTGATK